MGDMAQHPNSFRVAFSNVYDDSHVPKDKITSECYWQRLAQRRFDEADIITTTFYGGNKPKYKDPYYAKERMLYGDSGIARHGCIFHQIIRQWATVSYLENVNVHSMKDFSNLLLACVYVTTATYNGLDDEINFEYPRGKQTKREIRDATVGPGGRGANEGSNITVTAWEEVHNNHLHPESINQTRPESSEHFRWAFDLKQVRKLRNSCPKYDELMKKWYGYMMKIRER